MAKQDSRKKAQELAQNVLRLARNTLVAELRFLNVALCRLIWVEDAEGTLATDGQAFYYNFVYVLRRWQTERAVLIRSYLHSVLHCIYHHPFVDAEIDQTLWDLACDIAVEASIDELEVASARCGWTLERTETLQTLRQALKGRLTAEKIYRYYAGQALSGTALEALRAPFFRDEHTRWYQRREEEREEKKSVEEENKGRTGQAGGEKHPQKGGEEQPGAGENPKTGEPNPKGTPQPAQGKAARREAVKAQWEQLAMQVQSDLETHSRRWGDRAGSLLQNLREGNRKKLDYREFLRQFAVWSEVMQVDSENFDYIFYTYGLQLYGNMPLVEPLEYTEKKRVRDFVIAIDTSASVQGEKVQNFLTQTCQLLLQEGAYDTRIELHVLECDAKVQRDTVLCSTEDVHRYLADWQFTGGGGTDFRPVFDYVDKMHRMGRMPNLKGILYFTDGDGAYPQKPPDAQDCKVVFVFANQEDAAADVPPWAIKVILDTDSLGQEQILYFA